MSKNKLFLIGAGGHAKVVAEIAEEIGYNDIIFLESPKVKNSLLGYTVIDGLNAPQSCVIAIGNNTIRKRIVEETNNSYISLIHPLATVSKRAKINEGSVLMAGVTINCDVIVGKHCIINTNASIDHDCIIENFVHISPNVALAGNVFVGEGTHIGIGASIIQGIKIGSSCVIGAGSVIIRDVPSGVTIVGNPGRILND